jgi:hypothetical protein
VKLLPLPERDGSASQHARELLARCEAGEVLAVTVLEERPDGTYHVHGSRTPDRLRTAGALLDAAVTRLGSSDV